MLSLLRVLMLLACGPLLVPAGLCVCHADDLHAVTDAHDHQSDCPASVQVDASQPTPATPTPIDLGPTPEPPTPATAFATTRPSGPFFPPAARIPSPPLFVSHCALIL